MINKGTKTSHLKVEEERKWFILNVDNKILGKAATKIAALLIGSDKKDRSPHIDNGSFVVVLNAEKVALTGNKEEDKVYYRHSGTPGGLKMESVSSLRRRKPQALIRNAVNGMLPKSVNRKERLARLKVYAGDMHPHKAQNPQEVDLT
ncbi:50S ribosomal protein L13 [bacterium]|nr:50S ribosomal protein L13 [bacterium]|tara:strand:- start:118 stop:561 length:444 start_codon:yes stop_codon:yes gene_type:complete